MKGDPRPPLDWFRAATQDHARALRALEDSDVTASVLWMQQTSEKALKGWLIGQGWDLVKTHDLERLANECLAYGTDLAFFLPAGRRGPIRR